MLVATFSLEASPAFICIFFLLATIGYITYINVGSKWLNKVIKDYKKSRKAKQTEQEEPGHLIIIDDGDFKVVFDPNWPVREQIIFLIRYWLSCVNSGFRTYQTPVIGSDNSVIELIGINTEGHPASFDYEGRWFCELNPLTFTNYDLLDLLKLLEPVLPVSYVHTNSESSIQLHFRKSTHDEVLTCFNEKLTFKPTSFTSDSVTPFFTPKEESLKSSFKVNIAADRCMVFTHQTTTKNTDLKKNVFSAVIFWFSSMRKALGDGFDFAMPNYNTSLISEPGHTDECVLMLDKAIFQQEDFLKFLRFIEPILPVADIKISLDGDLLILFENGHAQQPAH